MEKVALKKKSKEGNQEKLDLGEQSRCRPWFA